MIPRLAGLYFSPASRAVPFNLLFAQRGSDFACGGSIHKCSDLSERSISGEGATKTDK